MVHLKKFTIGDDWVPKKLGKAQPTENCFKMASHILLTPNTELLVDLLYTM